MEAELALTLELNFYLHTRKCFRNKNITPNFNIFCTLLGISIQASGFDPSAPYISRDESQQFLVFANPWGRDGNSKHKIQLRLNIKFCSYLWSKFRVRVNCSKSICSNLDCSTLFLGISTARHVRTYVRAVDKKSATAQNFEQMTKLLRQ